MTVESEILADSPVAYYPLTGNASDSSGNGHHLTVHQPGTSSFGTYWPFGSDGTRGTVVYSTGVSTPGDWSIEFRLECRDPTSGPTPHGVVWQDDGLGENAVGAMPQFSSTRYLDWGSGLGTFTPCEGEAVAHHYVAVCDGGAVTIYRGKSQFGNPAAGIDATWSGTSGPAAGEWLIGNAGGAMYAGVAIFDFALTPERVLAHLTGSTLVPEPEPGHPDTLDSFSVDGPLEDSTPSYGFGWSVQSPLGGTTEVASGALVSDQDWFQASTLLSDSGSCLDPPSILSVDVDIGAGFYGGVLLGWQVAGQAEVLVGALFTSFGGSAELSSRHIAGGWGWGSFAVAYPSITSPGTYNLTVSFEAGGSIFRLWVDGVQVLATHVSDEAPPVIPFKDALLGETPCDVSPVLGVTMNSSNASITFTNLQYGFTPPVIGGLDAPPTDGGVARIRGMDVNVYVAGFDAPELGGGAVPPPLVDYYTDIHIGGLGAPRLSGGLVRSFTIPPTPTTPPPIPPDTPGYQYGEPTASITAAGYDVLGASFSTTMNSAGSGSFNTLPPGPSEGDEVVIAVAGTAVFAGYASVSNHEVATGEENEQTVTVELADTLEVDWTETVVWPDIAASAPERLGRPPQDDRVWNWHSNAGTWEDDELASSVGSDPARYGTEIETFAYPDQWADPYAKWMWDRDPDGLNAPKGWVYFRVPFGLLFAKEVMIELVAWDYAELAIDGQVFITADQPGATFRHDLHLDWDYHLCTIAAYCEGGKGGVKCTIMPKEKHGFTPSVMNSRGGWKILAYPEKPLRMSPGKVLERLVAEAKKRGAPAGKWTLEFDEYTDSSGESWPEDFPAIDTRVGMTYWDVLNMLAEGLLDFRKSPSGKTLYAYVKGSPPKTSSSPWSAGVDLSDRIVDRSIR